jgi:hypothetical protein
MAKRLNTLASLELRANNGIQDAKTELNWRALSVLDDEPESELINE